MTEKILNQRVVYQGNFIKLHHFTVELPNGSVHQREIVRHLGAVAIVALDDADNILMIRQYRLGALATMLEIPAGGLEPDESPATCAQRELREETGFGATDWVELGGWYPVPGYSTEYLHLFLAKGLQADPLDGDADEQIELVSMPFAEAVEKVHRGEIQNSTAICGILKAQHYLSQR
jgi:ADP-ribose pyrophosphatase